MASLIRQCACVCLLLMVVVMPATAQNLPEPENAASFVAVDCAFVREGNRNTVRAVLTGADGLPIPRDAYTARVSVVETGDVLPPEQIEARVVTQRPPLQIILVFDITNTVPIESLVNAISTELAPQLQVQDRLALITFGPDVSPRTQFYTDKNRLINEHMIDLLPLDGDNRMYDALLEAVTDFPLNADGRKVVLMLTDSNPRGTNQAGLREIINRAQRDTVEIYSIGFNSGGDDPDIAGLSELARETGGYAWLWDAEFISREGIQTGVGGRLDDFIATLNTEITLDISTEDVRPNDNGFITYEIAIDTANDATLTDQIACPVESLDHEIRFLDALEDGSTVRGPVDIAVSFDTDLAAEEVVPVFLVNNEIAQDTGETVFRFNEPPAQPGYYTIGAQLRSRTGEVLAATPTAFTLYVQAEVAFNVIEAEGGALIFELLTDPAFRLPGAVFNLSPVDDPDAARRLNPEPAPFVGGRAAYTVENVRERVIDLFPEEAANNEAFAAGAAVPGVGVDDPQLGTTEAITITLPPEPEPEPVRTVRLPSVNLRFLPTAAIIFFVALNLLLFRYVGRARVRRMLAAADNIELDAQLMSLTVRREGVNQTHPLTKKTVSIGRGSSNDINLGDDPAISRNHAVVMWRNGAWVFTNRKRRTVSRVNGRRRVGLCYVKLTPITEIEVGRVLLIFHSNAQTDLSEFIKTNL